MWCGSLCLLLLLLTLHDSEAGAIRFFGTGSGDIDRIKIQVDTVGNSNPGPPVDIGSDDFTVEFWLKGTQTDNTAAAITCGANNNWINGNIVVDRDRFNQSQNFGISLGDGRVVFGVMGDSSVQRTIGCGGTDVLDGAWHHIAVTRQRSDGAMEVYVDGTLQDSATGAQGPDGDISYPDDGVPCSNCCTNLPSGPDCDASDPYIVLGAEKHDAGGSFPSFNGFFDELRLSNLRRYTTNFTRPSAPFGVDANTLGLYHFDEMTGTITDDASGQPVSQNGTLLVGGANNGPQWTTESPFPPPSAIGDVEWFQ